MREFILYPAIDLRHGQVVRLQQGEADAQTVYGDNAAKVAADFEAQGAKWIHVVNLDGAFGEESPNIDVLKEILATVEVPVQFGGGIRNAAQAHQVIELGVSRVILGTAALTNPELVKELTSAHAGKIAVGIDCRKGMVAVEGWTETSTTSAADLVIKMRDAGVSHFIYTDIARDGMLVGPDVKGTVNLQREGIDVVASGGVGNLEHIADCAKHGLAGVIVGKAIYEQRFTLKQALKTVTEARQAS
ncbi:1-(5-phosphoribosyl)-5-[(5-phosphoribosylamino)methylideneamino]imidazole-4-carboxamide isomerase [Planctomycetota bacterium]|nr:1-(5-phosphoribosyl)-5-[(5-phosphoribosylamino)methylideneamino]imidazole-4-carboxamide isomerase [Planctomycetota bacterium]